uniref:Snf2 related CREBBP activator protein n=1 Tax=Pseudonaja textilis TaxID=8673 RepID=A0A670Z8P8_PSETE
KMTGSNPVSPASSSSPASSGSISPSHLTHDSSLDSHLSFDGPMLQNRALVSSGLYISPDPASMWDKTHAEIAEQAKHEAEIENRIAEMKKEGLWSLKRLSKVPEPIRPKVHWDYLCEEMQWLSADFVQERRWKRGFARKVVRMVIRHHEEQKQKEERAKREEQAKLRRIASSIAKEVKQFWSNVEKVVQFKQQSRLEEKRKKALDLQLDFIVGQTEKYSDLLTQSLNESLPVPSKTSGSHVGSTASSPPPPGHLMEDEDGDFQPHEESDDEETIEVEEQQEGNDSETQLREIELLKQESELPLEELLQTLPPQILENSFSVSPCASSSDDDDEEEGESEEEKPKPVTQRNKKPWKPDEEDEFTANEEEAKDEEETIDAEEKLEGNVDHCKEMDDLAKEGELPMDELLQKYAGAYASDFEVEASDTLSEALEPTTSEYKEESEEENSTYQSGMEGRGSEEIEENEQEESEVEDALEEERREASVIQEEDFGVEYLLKQDDNGGKGDNDLAPAPGPKKEITDIAAAAESLQPKGYTLATTQVKTPIPYLLRGTLREYQHIGLNWLVTMYEKKLNGILADEMGLGKTIQTISLLAHLACEKGSWGPHLIIVPTSVILNWEMEIKRWCPSFKILTYYGAQKERKLKRQGWTKPNAFHICITSYKLVLQDHQAFRRKNWKYLILDEAQNIKNFKSQRWQSLLNFNSQRRLLLTGTPLQNSLMELWSLMHFLMPHVFQSHREFKEWFSNPLTGMIEGSQEYNDNLVKRLHKVLRPFLLRRVKVDVEKQMPKKYEHVIKCRLSKCQRYLYDDFMGQATTKETLATGHFMNVINILMQLRKVCNHPNLFDPRPIHSPFIMEGICFNTASLVLHAFDYDPFKNVDLDIFDLINLEGSVSRYETDTFLPKWKMTRKMIEEIAESPDPPPRPKPVKMKVNRMLQPMPKPENRTVVLVNSHRPTTPLQRPITPVLLEPLTPALAPVPHTGSVLPGPLQTTTLPASVSLPVLVTMPPSPVTMTVPVQQNTAGEVVSIGQLASLANRPLQGAPGSKPLTFQIQGNKLTLTGTQVRQVTMPQPARQLPMPSSAVNSSSVVKIVVRQAPRDVVVSSSPGPQHLPMCPVTPTTASTLPGLPTALLAQRAPLPMNPASSVRLPNQPLGPVRPSAPAPLQTLVRPILRMIQASNPNLKQQLGKHVLKSPGGIAGTGDVNSTFYYSYTTTTPFHPGPKAETATSSPTPLPFLSGEFLGSGMWLLGAGEGWGDRIVEKLQQGGGKKLNKILSACSGLQEALEEKRKKQKEERLDRLFRLNEQHCNLAPIYGTEVLRFCTLFPPVPPSPGSGYTHCYAYWQRSETLAQAVLTPQQRIEELTDIIERFIFVMSPVEAPAITMHASHPPPTLLLQQSVFKETLRQELSPHASCLHHIILNMRTQFPDLRLIQYDCGKLQALDVLLWQLKAGAHRVLIFTQMTRMLDVLEQFLNYHGHIYLRLDGSTRVEQRQALMERFNADKRIFCFILSTRSGGVGVNLTGADTVVFYDSDWNPTMDAQAQDRCHRIGQTRDVHIYRLISERTVEENILKKANQKRMLGDMAIEGGNFTTAYFKQQMIRELFDMPLDEATKKEGEAPVPVQEEEEDPMATKQTQILEQALCKAEDPEDIWAATQAKAEQVAELAEFNENIPLDAEDRSSKEEEEAFSKAEQEIASLVEQLTPIERYAMNFLEASLEDISREELKQAEEQVEAARKDIDQAKDEVLFKLPEDEDESYLLEEGSSKKSKKAKISSRTLSERTGTRMSERLRSTRLPPKDGDSGDVESSQMRLPNLQHSRIVTDEEDDNLPQVAQHTRSALVRRELVWEEKRAQIVLNTRRTLTRQEELWNKGPTSGEKVQKIPLHRSKASGGRVLRTNLHRTDTPSAGDKLLQATPQKSDPGAGGDRILRGITSKTETLLVDERLPGSVPQASDTNLDKVPRPGLQKPEKPSRLDKLTCSSPKPEVSRTEVKAPDFHLQGLDGEAFKLKADVEEQKTQTEISQFSPPTLDFHPDESAADKEVPAFQKQDTLVTGKLLGIQALPDAGKLNIPGSKIKATTPVSLGIVELTSESKPEVTGEINLPVIEQKMSVQKPTEGADVSTSCNAAEGESVNSVDEATRQIFTQETTAPPDNTAKVVTEPLSSKSTKDATWEAADSAASFVLNSEVPKMDPPVFSSLGHCPATSSLLQLETLTCIKEQNGLKEYLRSGDLPSPLSSLLTEPQLGILPLGGTSPKSETADNKVNSLGETTAQNQEAVGENNHGVGPQEARLAAVCPGSASQESSSLPGNLSSDDSLSPNKPPCHQTTPDVQIQQSCQTPGGPAAKVLCKLPGRLVMVVEGKELIHRRRNLMCKLDSAPSTVMNLGSSLAQSLSEPEIPPSTKALPLLRDLPARRRIELESRAAAKEKDDGLKGGLLSNTSSEPVKRKRGRPPKNKSLDQQSPGLLQPFPKQALEISPQRKAPMRKTPEGHPRTQSPEQKGPENYSPKSESSKSKADSSENGDSPVEKRRRGRPPKTRQSPLMPPKSPALEALISPSTKPQTVELPTNVQKKLSPANSPPKRKRGRPPRNPSSPQVEVAQLPTSNSDQETSLEKHTLAPPGCKRQRHRRKDDIGPSLPSTNQSSLDGETRPLTRLALLKQEEKPESCSGALVQPSSKHTGTEQASLAESSTWEQPSSDTPARSTRLRPGCLVPPLELETQRRKRRCSMEGKRVRNSSKSPASQGIAEQEGGEPFCGMKRWDSYFPNQSGGQGRGNATHNPVRLCAPFLHHHPEKNVFF